MTKIKLENNDDKQLMCEVIRLALNMMSQGGITAKDVTKLREWHDVANTKSVE